MKRILAAVGGLIALTGAAFAQTDGFVTTDVNLRAGPGVDYPPVAVLAGGTPLEIFGCLDDYSWCDIDWRGYRGWVAAQYLEYDYRGRRVVLPEYAPTIGVPIIGFSVGEYWGRYYRDRPWYEQRYRWAPAPHRRPPPPPPVWHGGPPPGSWERGGWDRREPDRRDWDRRDGYRHDGDRRDRDRGGSDRGGWDGRRDPPRGDWRGPEGRPPREPAGAPQFAPPPPQQARPAPPPQRLAPWQNGNEGCTRIDLAKGGC